MTINEFFNRPHELEKAIALEQERLQHYRDMAERCTANWSGINVGSSNEHSKMEIWVEKITECEKRIETLRMKYGEAVGKVIDVVYALDNDMYTRVLAQKFVDDTDAADIAMSMNYSPGYIRRLIRAAAGEAEIRILKYHPEYLEEDAS